MSLFSVNKKFYVLFIYIILILGFFVFPSVSQALGQENEHCECDNGENILNGCTWGGVKCVSSAPYCIKNNCHVTQNPIGGDCGENADCTTNRCAANHKCTILDSANKCTQYPMNDCNGGHELQITNTFAYKCFWYLGNPVDGTDRARCVQDTGNKGNACPNNSNGYCYAGQDYCLSDTNGNYCSSTPEAPSQNATPTTSPAAPSSTKPDCSVRDDQLSIKNGYAICSPECSTGETKNIDYICSKDTYTKEPQYCCESKTGVLSKELPKVPGNDNPPHGGGTAIPTAPNSATSTPTPMPLSKDACAYHGGVKYGNPPTAYCGSETYDSTKAAKTQAEGNPYCGQPYTSRYECSDGTMSNPILITDQTVCNKPPWCPSSSTTVTPTPGLDAGCKAYQGQTCHPGDNSNKSYCCEPNKNLECVDSCNPNTTPGCKQQVIYACQFKKNSEGTPAPFTPTPGASKNCNATGSYSNGLPNEIGCPCSTGYCSIGACYPRVGGAISNPSDQYCAGNGQRWCTQNQSSVSDPSLCSGNPVPSTQNPMPTGSYGPISDLCPIIDPGDNQPNSCWDNPSTGPLPAGSYSLKSTDPNAPANASCSQHTSGLNPWCWHKKAVSSATPTPATALDPRCPVLDTDNKPNSCDDADECTAGYVHKSSTEGDKDCTTFRKKPSWCCHQK